MDLYGRKGRGAANRPKTGRVWVDREVEDDGDG
jgi:hypothetical protein